MTPDQLLTTQTEIQNLSEEYNHFQADWKGAKVRFVDIATKLITDDNKQVAAKVQSQTSQAAYTVQLRDDAHDDIPHTDEPARAAEEIAGPEEPVTARTTASAVPEKNAPPTPKSSQVKKVKLPSAREVKKTKAHEKEAAKKRKASTSSESSEARRLRTLKTSSTAPIDATPINVAPSYVMVPFGAEYVIQEGDEQMEDTRCAASTPIHEEIEADPNPSIPQASSPPPQQNRDVGDEDKDEYVDIGNTTPVIHDDFWEQAHPNSPLTTLIPQVPLSPAATDIHITCEEKSTSVKSIPETESTSSADDNANQTAAE
ncbi:hypothetical protein ZWY2020_009083 [Hordeum vulgare]|nr:hypothetical protein ZWY2020_009083 [Hordeum vulgare]